MSREAHLVIVIGVMSLEEQKMLEVFLRLSPLRFSRVVNEDTHEFLNY